MLRGLRSALSAPPLTGCTPRSAQLGGPKCLQTALGVSWGQSRLVLRTLDTDVLVARRWSPRPGDRENRGQEHLRLEGVLAFISG